ncbi:putative uncharacterized protein [Firmicutes bacterium CAG:882]|jgi:uncharacterized membrane-anchored protein YitT (DUF2179 family)|nr:putative uncharacterized protein [Firmicutes bacterium CAG:882]
MSHINSKSIQKIIMILLGNLLYSFAIAFFILPSGLITGGTTGIALFVNYLTGLDISLFVLIFNIVMFIAGLIILGKTFALSTVLSSIAYPFMLSFAQWLNRLTGDLTHDLILCTIFGGLLIGIGIGIVIRAGASTGGMDIPPLVLNKKFGINVSVSLYAFDFTILILQMFFSGREQILYGILLVCIYTFALEKVLIMGKSKTQVEIISEKYKEINDLIITRFDRGTTIYQATGGFTGNEAHAVLTVINKRELFAIQEAVMKLDPAAFIIISQVNEVKGRGFTLQKKYPEDTHPSHK